MQLFVYGTLLDPDIQVKIIGRKIDGIADALVGFKKVERQFLSGKFPDLIVDQKSATKGMILSLSEEEIARCDEYEGKEYKKMVVRLKSGREVLLYKGI